MSGERGRDGGKGLVAIVVVGVGKERMIVRRANAGQAGAGGQKGDGADEGRPRTDREGQQINKY